LTVKYLVSAGRAFGLDRFKKNLVQPNL